MEETKKKFKWESLLIGVLSIVLGIYALMNPDSTLSSIVVVCGIFAIIYGIFTFIVNYRMRKATGKGGIFEMIVAVAEVVLGVYLLFNIEVGLVTLPILFAIWFLIDTVKDMIFVRFIKLINKSLYNVLMVLSVVRLVIAIMLVYNPLASLIMTVYLVGTNFILTGVKSLILAFYDR